jgi:hypothetical protein
MDSDLQPPDAFARRYGLAYPAAGGTRVMVLRAASTKVALACFFLRKPHDHMNPNAELQEAIYWRRYGLVQKTAGYRADVKLSAPVPDVALSRCLALAATIFCGRSIQVECGREVTPIVCTRFRQALCNTTPFLRHALSKTYERQCAESLELDWEQTVSVVVFPGFT